MVTLAEEIATRLIPWEPEEAAYARNRPHAERPAWPQVGQQVYYRRNEWDSDGDLHLMRVVAVQDPEDRDSEWAPMLWQQIRDNATGAPVVGHIVAVPDPWPWVQLVWEGPYPKGLGHAWRARPQMTWESRMRGSAGWLPLDYQRTRPLRLPHSGPLRPLPAPRRPARAQRGTPPAPAPTFREG